MERLRAARHERRCFEKSAHGESSPPHSVLELFGGEVTQQRLRLLRA
jgi:hypothetical protein